jgi:hypothetical protein
MGTENNKIRWAIAASIAGTVIVAMTMIFSLPPPPRPAIPGGAKLAPVQLARPAGGDEVLKDEALIRDLRPLFLPTAFNAHLPEPRREPGRSILDDERLQLDFTEGEPRFARDLPPVAVLNGRPADEAKALDMLALTDGDLALAGFGRRVRKVQPLEPRGGYVEVVAVSTGKSVLAEALPASLGPPGGKAWEPMEMFAAVDAAGLAVPLVVTEGSRVDEVDAHFKRVIAQGFRIGDRLPPGFYRIVIGP